MIVGAIILIIIAIVYVYRSLLNQKKKGAGYGVLPSDMKNYLFYYVLLALLFSGLFGVVIFYFFYANTETQNREYGSGSVYNVGKLEEELGVEKIGGTGRDILSQNEYGTGPKTIPQSGDKNILELIGPYKVVKVIDGDTIWVEDHKEKFKVRFIGINTPELGACYSYPAKDFLTKSIGANNVYLELDDTQYRVDKYGRVLAYVRVGGINLNAELLKWGYANEYTYKVPYKYQEVFQMYEKNAEKEKLGIWNDCI